MSKFMSNLVTGLLVVCAITVTATAVADRIGGPDRPKPREIEGWQELMVTGIRIGSEDAPVQMIEFVDLQCPFCARLHASVVDAIERYPNEVAWTFIHFPLGGHPEAVDAAVAVECAVAQGMFMEYLDHAFRNQDRFAEAPWVTFAEEIGLPDQDQFQRCVEGGPTSHPRIAAGREAGESIAITGTPSVLVNGWLQPSVRAESLDSLIQAALER